MVSLAENEVHRWARARRVHADPELPLRARQHRARSQGSIMYANAFLVFPFLLLVTVLVLYLAWRDATWSPPRPEAPPAQ
jgi:hypothetical protein